MPKDFSQNAIAFDHEPSDIELSCLLGMWPRGDRLRYSESPRDLRVGPWLFPMRYLIPWMIFTGVVMSVIFWYTTPPDLIILHTLVVLAIWLIILPSFIGFCWWWNKQVTAGGDYAYADKTRQTLELPRHRRTLTKRQLRAFVDLKRRYSTGGERRSIRQTGLLAVEDDGRLTYLAVAHEELSKEPLADRLAEIFMVPVRRVKLTNAESRALENG